MDDILAPIRKAHEDAPAVAGEIAHNPAYFQGDVDDDGNVRSCPEGTYPHARITVDDIVARGGLDAYLDSAKQAPPRQADVTHPASAVPVDGGLQSDTGYYAWVQTAFSMADTLTSVQGGQSTMTIASPTLDKYSGDHSIAQVWLTGADHATGLPRQTLEAGWEATANGTVGARPAYLFVGTTNDGYAAFCEDDNPNTACPAWVPNPTASLAFGTPLPASTPGGTQHELAITMQHQYSLLISCIIKRGCSLTKLYHGWGVWASVDGGGADTYLGYYDNDGFDNDGSSGLSIGGDSFTVGGEIFDSGQKWGPPPEVTMGEGPLVNGKAKYGTAAYHHDFGYLDSTSTLQTGGSTIYNTNSEYVFDISTPPGNTSWVNYFYYGDYAP